MTSIICAEQGEYAACQCKKHCFQTILDKQHFFSFYRKSEQAGRDRLMEICYPLAHSAGNPRNSEGAFVSLADGSLFFAYSRYSGKHWNDHASADICAIVSKDQGNSWSEPFVLVKNPALNVMSVSFLRLQDGRIALVYLQKSRVPGTDFIDCRPKICFSSDEAQSWSEPIETATCPFLYLVMHNDRLVQLANGRLLMPLSYHRYGNTSKAILQGIGIFLLSDDSGISWRQSEGCCYPPQYLTAGLMEPGIIELSDGKILCWYRTAGGCQYKAWSHDGGEHWTAPIPASEFPSPSSPLAMKRDPKSGDLIAIWNDYSPERSVHFHEGVIGRTPLVLARSHDEGRTWTDHSVLENAPDHGYAYTAMEFADKRLYLAYCCGGRSSCNSMLQDIRIRSLTL